MTDHYRAEISSLPYGKLEGLMQWCKHYCENDWNCAVLEPAGKDPGKYEFTFTTQKDYVNFMLWQA